MGILLTTDTAFATIAGDELTAAGEFVDGQTAVVGTALAFAILVSNCRSQIF